MAQEYHEAHGSYLGMNWAYVSDRGSRRENNEDRALVREMPGRLFAVVADGMGGHANGEFASGVVTEALGDYFSANAHGTTADSAAYANRVLAEKIGSMEGRPGAVAVWCVARRESGVYTAELGNVGDTRAYRISPDSITQLTEDQSAVRELRKQGKWNQMGPAERKRMAHVVTNAFCNEFRPEEVQAIRLELAPGDYLALFSDGVHGEDEGSDFRRFLSDDEIAAVVRSQDDLMQRCSSVVHSAIERGSRDNASGLLLYFT
ncbi:MAG: serine/threonine-protein phosphatase [Candidatus Aenigmarchaeota archaeon]|nr:serine/threonine-protein phosphatase [Candidatus Aenigmarchaeota archaeon]